MFYASAAALRRVVGYVATTRADAVRRARRHRRDEQVPGKLVVTRIGQSLAAVERALRRGTSATT